MNLDDALRRASKGVVFDTNVLLAFIVGCWDISKLSTFKRTMAFVPRDLELMGAILAGCGGKLSVTPAILAETCNLCDGLNTSNNQGLFKIIVELVEFANDRRKESRLLCKSPSFLRLGFADASVIDCSISGSLLITDDLKCYLDAQRQGGLVINFNHVRNWGV